MTKTQSTSNGKPISLKAKLAGIQSIEKISTTSLETAKYLGDAVKELVKLPECTEEDAEEDASSESSDDGDTKMPAKKKVKTLTDTEKEYLATISSHSKKWLDSFVMDLCDELDGDLSGLHEDVLNALADKFGLSEDQPSNVAKFFSIRAEYLKKKENEKSGKK